jgi:hypothetical protein
MVDPTEGTIKQTVSTAPLVELDLKIESPLKELIFCNEREALLSKTPKFGKLSTRRGS